MTSASIQLCLLLWQKKLIHGLCNKNQLDALFILSLFHQSTSTCFEHICSPSSGGMLCVCVCVCVCVKQLLLLELERVCSQTQLCQLRCLMTILDNYMFRPLLAIFRLSLRELYNVRTRDGEISNVISGLPATRPHGRTGTRLFIPTSNSILANRPHRAEHATALNIVVNYYATRR